MAMEMEEMDLLELWEILAKRKGLIITLFVLSIIAAGVANVVMEPVYEVSATLMANSKTGSLAALDPLSALTGGSNRNVALQNYVHLLKSRTILEGAMLKSGWETVTDNDIDKITKKLSIQPIQGTDIIKISMQSNDPKAAEEFVNNLVDVFITATRDANRLDLRTAREFLTEQLQLVAANLEAAEERLREYKERERILEPSEEIKVVLQHFAYLESVLADISLAKIDAQQKIYEIEQKLQGVDQIITSSTVVQENPMVRNYQSRLAELEITLSGLRERYTERHPSIISIQAEIEETKGRLAQEVERVVGSETLTRNPIYSELYGQLIAMQVELAALEAKEAAMIQLQQMNEDNYLKLPAKELELIRLIRDVTVAEEIYVMLMTRNEEIRINEAMHAGSLQAIDRAIVPEEPIKPRKMLNFAIAGVLGLFVGAGIAFLLDYVDNTIKTKEEAEKILGLPVLGQIPVFNNETERDPLKNQTSTLRM